VAEDLFDQPQAAAPPEPDPWKGRIQALEQADSAREFEVEDAKGLLKQRKDAVKETVREPRRGPLPPPPGLYPS
jgi:hypothetical protein